MLKYSTGAKRFDTFLVDEWWCERTGLRRPQWMEEQYVRDSSVRRGGLSLEDNPLQIRITGWSTINAGSCMRMQDPTSCFLLPASCSKGQLIFLMKTIIGAPWSSVACTLYSVLTLDFTNLYLNIFIWYLTCCWVYGMWQSGTGRLRESETSQHCITDQPFLQLMLIIEPYL